MNAMSVISTTSWSVAARGSSALAGRPSVSRGGHHGAHRDSYRPEMWSAADAFMAGSSFTAMANAVAGTTCAAGNPNGTKRSPQRLGESLT